MKSKILVCILFWLAPLCSKAQNYDGYAYYCYSNTCEKFIVSSMLDGADRMYRIKNASGEIMTVHLFTRKTNGKWVLVGRTTLKPGKKETNLIQKDGTEKVLLFYYVSARPYKVPTAEEVNRVESSY